jgi:hypothetical protein
MTVWRMRIACWITKATNTHSDFVILLLYRSGYANAPLRYVIHTLPVLFRRHLATQDTTRYICIRSSHHVTTHQHVSFCLHADIPPVSSLCHSTLLPRYLCAEC